MTKVILRNAEAPAGDAAVIPPPELPEPVIKNTFFFPDVDPKRIRQLMRLEHTVTPERLRRAIKSGIAETNAELFDYRAQQMAAGFGTLAEVPAESFDGESEKCFHYLNAVCAMATAVLYERYRSADASAKGDKKADGVDASIDEHWRDMRWSISRLQDKPRCIVGQI
ncbi:head completion/stabilization protein [Serratia ficaria]|uniref:head completion/stabilization protein n=1 Tax=Serratia ficaria TaxID=61651 RepID=UPI00217A9CF8|nr:head completion/stabilization protein [Serratia ficaria]CAI1148856.1 Phage head completion protein (GPL) [Serratia ficaria]CAI2007974.1 Phage head completion protein (GPL) [Serratia ficaria]CAI2518039.1 Phage head completion protein (GPL) [Serratia ficaria]